MVDGRFYYVMDAFPNRVGGDVTDCVHPLCPRGWRIPTKEDWELLIADSHADKNPENLALGGNSDFNGTYMGFADYGITWLAPGVPLETIYTFRDAFKKAWFFSSSQPRDPNRSDLFMVQVDRTGPALWTGWESLNLYIPVRCIKD